MRYDSLLSERFHESWQSYQRMDDQRAPIDDRGEHWEAVWSTKEHGDTSWFQEVSSRSLEEIRNCGGPTSSVIDVGGGGSTLVDGLIASEYSDVTVLDLSAAALETSKRRLGDAAQRVSWIAADILSWRPERTWDIWHDRAVLHFMVDDEQVDAYLGCARSSIRIGGHLVVEVFGPDGPDSCSGLPTRSWSADELGLRFAPDFELIRSGIEMHITPWASPQQFVIAVFQRIDTYLTK